MVEFRDEMETERISREQVSIDCSVFEALKRELNLHPANSASAIVEVACRLFLRLRRIEREGDKAKGQDAP